MAKGNKKLLPKNFEALLQKGDLAALKAVYDDCDVNARWGEASFKQTALAHEDCPDELTRWLIGQGADTQLGDHYGVTPLHARIGWTGCDIGVLLELGADPNAGEGERGTPLHTASERCNIEAARALLEHGARIDALDTDGLTPLAYALQRCANSDLQYLAPLAKFMLEAGATKTPNMKEFVARLGKDFEFYRNDYEAESVEAASEAMDVLYELFDVPPAPRRTVYDGTSPIIANAKTWQGRHGELWEMLVPASGAADTVQGEVIRISGKIDRELSGNGGANWDAEYKKLTKAFLGYVQAGISLAASSIKEVDGIVKHMNRQNEDAERLCEFAVEWVAHNPAPMPLPAPKYKR